ncbi:hypothetical protein PanWU01x14_010320 [Parasponia andersonii]|uniref:Uncharacterized protein n=1 Tax=Parasponia andersonii TaxID=3476 RepID=A0A2P5E2Q2_PARAD|nr:hypothetical protein PanWU01x14_010320 [Parasponia andersonii]
MDVGGYITFGGGRGRQYAAHALLTLERTLDQRHEIDLFKKCLSKIITDMVSSPGHGGSGMDGGGGGGSSSGSAGGQEQGDSDDRSLVPEVFDRETMNVVLKEWKTLIKDLPLDLQQACMTGAMSSAKLTRFLWLNAQSSFVRLLARLLPNRNLSADITSKIMAEPSLPYKISLEALFSLGYFVWMDSRGSTALRVSNENRRWCLPTQSPTPLAMLCAQGLWRESSLTITSIIITRQLRQYLQSFRKTVALFAIGVTLKAVISDSQQEMFSIATVSKEALAAGLSLALVSNLRYRMVGDIDRRLQLHFDVPNVSLALCLSLRVLNIAIGTQPLFWVRSEDQSAAFSTRLFSASFLVVPI